MTIVLMIYFFYSILRNIYILIININNENYSSHLSNIYTIFKEFNVSTTCPKLKIIITLNCSSILTKFKLL